MTARLSALAALLLLAPTAPAADDWVPLFNGKDLTGWTPKVTKHKLGENPFDTFRVEDGLIKVRYDKYPGQFDGQFGHLFHKDKLSHYRLRVEYRFVGDQCPGGPGWATRNSGVMLHCQSPDTMRVDQEFPVSVECQFLGGLGKGKRTTANMCSPGTNIVLAGKLYTPHCTNSKSKTFDGDQWVTVEVEVRGAGKIRHFVNGEPVLEYEQPQYDPKDADAKKLMGTGGLLIKEGFVSLQAESHPVDFRKVEVKRLPAE